MAVVATPSWWTSLNAGDQVTTATVIPAGWDVSFCPPHSQSEAGKLLRDGLATGVQLPPTRRTRLEFSHQAPDQLSPDQPTGWPGRLLQCCNWTYSLSRI